MAHVVVVGAGGNIGSHLTPHLARMPGVTNVTLIDRDKYERANLPSQNIEGGDVGQCKAAVQAKRMGRVNPKLTVEAIHQAVEDVPLGSLRADLILACLDSRRSRMVLNQAARRLGVPWIDAGVSGDDLLARVQVFTPDPDAPCLECAWSQADYLVAEQGYPCQAPAAPAPTNASSSLGALAAAFQAIECEKWLAGQTSDVLVGGELLVSARYHKHFVTRARRNEACRMPDHQPWAIVRGDGPTVAQTVREALALADRLPDAGRHVGFSVAGQPLALSVTCPKCGRSKSVLRLARTARLDPTLCWHCRRPMDPAGFDLHDTLPARSIPPSARDQRLSRVGLRAGDVLTFSTPSMVAHYEVRSLA